MPIVDVQPVFDGVQPDFIRRADRLPAAHVATSGNQSLTHRPPCPCCFQARLLARIGELNSPIAVMTRPKLGGIGFARH